MPIIVKVDDPLRVDLARIPARKGQQYCMEAHKQRLREMIESMDREDIEILLEAIAERLKK